MNSVLGILTNDEKAMQLPVPDHAVLKTELDDMSKDERDAYVAELILILSKHYVQSKKAEDALNNLAIALKDTWEDQNYGISDIISTKLNKTPRDIISATKDRSEAKPLAKKYVILISVVVSICFVALVVVLCIVLIRSRRINKPLIA